LRAWDQIAIVQVVKQRNQGQLTIHRRVVQGCTQMIERLKATFRQRLACLTRRSRALARQPQTLRAGTSIFTRQVQKLLTEDEYNELQLALVARPDLGAIMVGSGGLRKVR
jgi:hypothetical protein